MICSVAGSTPQDLIGIQNKTPYTMASLETILVHVSIIHL